jgi:hypothetical protein
MKSISNNKLKTKWRILLKWPSGKELSAIHKEPIGLSKAKYWQQIVCDIVGKDENGIEYSHVCIERIFDSDTKY